MSMRKAEDALAKPAIDFLCHRDPKQLKDDLILSVANAIEREGVDSYQRGYEAGKAARS